MRKRGFTLIEMMVVIAVLVTLMMVSFRLSNIGGESEKRTITITRLQRLENCLSGFHAAFGCYPPVKLHGNRSLHQQDQTINWGNESEAWRWVQEVCRTQPMGCRFPFASGMRDLINELSDFIKNAAGSGEFDDVFDSEDARNWAAAGFMSPSESAVEGRLSSKRDKVLWSELKLFQYGVMSYLLPRYLVMMGGQDKYYQGNEENESGYAQWTLNNQRPSDPFTGAPMEWNEIYNWVENYHQSQQNGRPQKNKDIVKIEMIPSQAVCARWMPNLEGICKCNFPTARYPYSDSFFGVHIKSSYWGDAGVFDAYGTVDKGVIQSIRQSCFSSDANGSYQDQYLLNEVTVQDGWGTEFFYYSRSPYQSYTLWSAGPDRKTFPPWIARDSLRSNARSDSGAGSAADCAAKWTKDDIIHMSN